MPMVMENSIIVNIRIHCVMPLYVEVVIDLTFGGFGKDIIFICSK
jgi:hypothetical protein